MWSNILGLFVCLIAVGGDLLYSDEKYFKNIRQLTFSGHHSFPSFSDDGTQLVFAAHGHPYGIDCDQIFRLNLNDPNEIPARISPGIGYASRPKFWPNTQDITFQANFHQIAYPDNFVARKTCPSSTCSNANQQSNATAAKLCSSPYWDLFPNQDVFLVTAYGNIRKQFTNSSGYAGDAWVANPTFDGQKIYYAMSDDMGVNLYEKVVNVLDESTLLTEKDFSYFGGIAVDRDERRVAYHGFIPSTTEDKQNLRQALSYNIVPTSKMDIFTSEFDGFIPQMVKQVHGYINHDPTFANTHGNKIVFTSNVNRTQDFFSLYLYNLNDETIQPLSTTQGTTSTRFAAISNDFNRIVFTSNRNSTKSDEFQLFIADLNVTGSSSDPYFDGGHFSVKLEAENSVLKQQMVFPPEAADTCWQNQPVQSQFDGIIHFPGENHLKNIKQITFGGQNAEGYFSFDNNRLTIQATGQRNYGTECDQIYQIDLCKDPSQNLPHKMSTGLGACTCSFIYPDGTKSLYAGTFRSVKIDQSSVNDATCPMKKCSKGNPALKTDPILSQLCNTSYTWDIYPEYDIYLVNEYGIIQQQLTDSKGYDAEGVISPDKSMIAFTSMRHNDLDLYIMDLYGGNVRQITNVTGYDGGAFFSPDSKRLIFRASRPKPGPELDKYNLLLKYDLVEPIAMELFVVDVDGSNMRQITNLGGANWAPYYHQDNKRVIFSSDFNATAADFGAFDLYLINDDGTGLERVTYDGDNFDSFAMFSHDGKKLVWGSSRNGSQYDLNLFIADWVDPESNDNPTVPTVPTPPSQTKTPPSTDTTTTPIATTTKSNANFVNISILLIFISQLLL